MEASAWDKPPWPRFLMHELSIAISVLEVAQEEAERHGGKLLAIHMRIGALSGVVPEALQGAYEIARVEAGLPDCRLVIEEIPIVVYCSKCAAERAIESILDFRCIECGEPAPQLIKGKEMQVYALELDE